MTTVNTKQLQNARYPTAPPPATPPSISEAAEPKHGSLGRGCLDRGRLTGERLAHLEAGEAADDDVFAQLGNLGIEQVVDRLGVVLDERLFEQADRAVIFV